MPFCSTNTHFTQKAIHSLFLQKGASPVAIRKHNMTTSAILNYHVKKKGIVRKILIADALVKLTQCLNRALTCVLAHTFPRNSPFAGWPRVSLILMLPSPPTSLPSLLPPLQKKKTKKHEWSVFVKALSLWVDFGWLIWKKVETDRDQYKHSIRHPDTVIL